MPGWRRALAPTIVDQDDVLAYRVVGREDQYSFIAGRIMRQAWREAPAPLCATTAPRNLIDAVEQVLRVRQRRRVIVRWTGQTLVSVTAAGMVAAALVLVLPRRPLISSHEPAYLTYAGPTATVGKSPPRSPLPSARDPRSMFVVAGVIPGRTSATPQALDSLGALGATPIQPGDSLSASQTSLARIASDEGTELTLEPGGSLTVVEAAATRRFALVRGAVKAQVKKLLAGERFIVQTNDAEIEVHGTQFRVASGGADPACANTSSTRVSVSEGVVTVRWSGHEERLFPGDEWPSKCIGAGVRTGALAGVETDSHPQPRAQPRAESGGSDRDGTLRKWKRPSRVSRSSPVAGARSNRFVASPAASDQPSPPPPSVLAAQNGLFTAAVRAKRAGRAADAVDLFDRFVRDYPTSSLIESALAQRMRLLAPRDLPAAGRAAAAYLARFPDGFARDDAQTFVAAAARL